MGFGEGFVFPLGGGGGHVWYLWLLKISVRSRQRFCFYCLSRPRSSLMNGSLARQVAFQGNDMSLSYLPEFVAKMESEWDPLPRFLFDDLWKILWLFFRRIVGLPCAGYSHLFGFFGLAFVPLTCPTRALSKNTVVLFI